jgi:hypothetical protein
MLYHKDRSELELSTNFTRLDNKKYSFLKNSIYHLLRVTILPKLCVMWNGHIRRLPIIVILGRVQRRCQGLKGP